ncbi:OLC1v1026674C1 [Oldenlandia corymbosa var. corymbosa]|uniref:Glycosyltransferase n=1 Tax=Oldenlandia corymbosa var. corymbosa TaxID=529605 RepID=A0AAV1C9U6_OLDCO|nr:OLC1v1026674C1 [Oldenlandia corymbosa var. corymbosa]
MDEKPKAPLPHLVFFPLPFQGPVNSMFKLAELFCLEGFGVTFVVTECIHRRLVTSSNIQFLRHSYPSFHLMALTDGLPNDHPRNGDRFIEVFNSLKINTMPLLKDLLISGSFWQPVTCIVADGLMGFAFDVAKETGIPIFYVRTIGPCTLWTFFCLPHLLDSGELPPLDTTNINADDMDRPVRGVPGTESFLRRRDLPRFSTLGDTAYESLQLLMKEGEEVPKAHGLILNTFEELDGPLLSLLRATCPNTYAIGPLHAHVKNKRSKQTVTESKCSSSSNLWPEDRSCLGWLDQQASKSVMYVSFGSIAIFSREKLMELWYGLVNSGVQFLWVIRPDSIIGENWEKHIPAELLEGTKQRGFIVGWAPQEEVIGHPAVGGFLTHSGWNSTLESIYAGVPMLCWPYFLDQQLNSRFVSEAWKVGLDMKDTCDRSIVEEMVRDLMDVRKEEFSRRAEELSELARNCLIEGGSSSSNFQRLIMDIRQGGSHSS